MQSSYYKQWDEVIYSLGPLTITAGNVEQFCWKITQSSCGDLFLQNDNLKRVDCWVGDVKTCNKASLSKIKKKMEKTASIEGNEYSVGIIGFRFTSAIYTTDLHISESSTTNGKGIKKRIRRKRIQGIKWLCKCWPQAQANASDQIAIEFISTCDCLRGWC